MRLLLSCLFALFLAVPPLAAHAANEVKRAELSGGDKEHARNALYFAERSNWNEAILHARRARNTVLRDYMTWRALRDRGSDFPFSTFEDFITRNPEWPDEKRLLIRAEDRLFGPDSGALSSEQKIRWFTQHPPVSGKGKLVYAEALQAQGNSGKIRELVRDAWVNGDFDANQEKEIMRRYASTLRQQDHIDRADRLVWEGKTDAASRMMFALSQGRQAVFEARILLSLNKPQANGALARVPAGLKSDPGLLYERMKWRERKGDMEEGVRELLLEAPSKVPYPEKWWKTRHTQARKALESGQTSLAVKLLQNHGQTDGVGQADALWLLGWIHLTRLNQPQKALAYFRDLDRAVTFPVSKSRAAYWAGRAAQAMGQPKIYNAWYAAGSAYPTTFYGQLCAVKAQKNAPMHLPRPAPPTAEQSKRFVQDSRVRVVYMLAEAGKQDIAYTFIGHLIDTAKNYNEAVMAAELGLAIGRQDYALSASKDALKQNRVLPQTGYPYYRIGFTPKIEAPLMWAITRQESLFNPYAQSSAGATGMMQLLPATAKEVARKNGIPFAPGRLNEVMYNLQLGSTYLGDMVRNFDGSYILAIAAYNAGPGRVRQWIGQYGHPGKDVEKAIDWIENIPYSETRNYVQRVIENLQVYRALTASGNGQAIRIDKDLTR